MDKKKKEVIVPAWRNVASNIWGKPSDPTIYGFLEVDVENILKFIETKRKETGEKITITHVISKVIADMFAQNPELNLIMKRGKLVPRKSIDIFVIVEVGGGGITGVKVKNADEKSLEEIAREIRVRAGKLKKGEKDELTKLIEIVGLLPSPAIRFVAGLLKFMMYEVGISIKGIDPDPFGSAMITNVGIFGLEMGLAPLFPFSRTPLIVTVGKVRRKPVIIDERVYPRSVITIGAAIDHRYFDGYHIGKLTKSFAEQLSKFAQ